MGSEWLRTCDIFLIGNFGFYYNLMSESVHSFIHSIIPHKFIDGFLGGRHRTVVEYVLVDNLTVALGPADHTIQF